MSRIAVSVRLAVLTASLHIVLPVVAQQRTEPTTTRERERTLQIHEANRWMKEGANRSLPKRKTVEEAFKEIERRNLERRKQSRPDTIRQLLKGDPSAWAILIGVAAGLLLVFLVSRSKMFQGQRKTDPGEIIEEFRKRRFRGWVAALIGVPATIAVPVYFAVVVGSAVATGVSIFVCFFVLLLVCSVNFRCPACGGNVGRELSPKHCSKCGVRLR